MSMLQVGEITFFDLKTKTVALSVLVSGCIDAVYLACLTDSTTYLLVRPFFNAMCHMCTYAFLLS